MPEDARKRARHRLSIARGHLESIVKMLDDPEVYCVDVLRQTKAVQGALTGAADVILRGHLEAHIATAAEHGDSAELVDELMEALKCRGERCHTSLCTRHPHVPIATPCASGFSSAALPSRNAI